MTTEATLRNWAYGFGIVLVAVGILGFIPALAPDGHLLGLFAVDTEHNVIHLLSGVAAIGAAMSSATASRSYFQIFGWIYALVALVGLFRGDQPLLGFVAHNWADFWLHLLIAATSLYLGYWYHRTELRRPVAHA